jgi:DNA invertase Pin-like site-specific DNA recombinase
VNETTRCAIYARYSSEKQNSLTIDQQIRKCREYADRNGLRLLSDHVYADEAISGATDDRAGLQRLFTVAKQHPRRFDVILVDDTSRLSRRLADSLHIHEELQFAGVRVIFVAQGIDTNSEQAELLVATHGIVDSMYLKDLAKRTFRGVEQGLSMGCTREGEFLATGVSRLRALLKPTAMADRSSEVCGSKWTQTRLPRFAESSKATQQATR